MDLGGFFGGLGNFLGSIGNDIGSFFNPQKKKQDQPQPQVNQPQQPQQRPQFGGTISLPQGFNVNTPQPNQPQNQPPATKIGGVALQNATSQPVQPQNQPVAPNNTYKGVDLSGLNDQDRAAAQSFIDRGKNAQPFIQASRSAEAAKNKAAYDNSLVGEIGNFGKNVAHQLIDSAEQGAGNLADVAIQGGGLLSHVGDVINPFLTPEQRQQAITSDAQASEALRGGIHGLTDTSGNPIAGTSGADVSATKINNGTANLGDIFNVGQTAANTGLAATMFDPAAYVPILKSVRGAGESGVKTVEGLLPREATNAEVPLTEPSIGGVTEQNKPITQATQTAKEPAITSANPNFQKPATVQAPTAPIAPQLPQEVTLPQPTASPLPVAPAEPSGVQPVVLKASETPATNEPTIAGQPFTPIQKVIDEQAAQKAPAKPVESAPVETPTTVATKQAVAKETPPPVTPEVQAALAKQAETEAPTEAIANETPKLGTITRDAVRDGSINTPEGLAQTVENTTNAAKAEAEAAGDSIENIIKKGDQAWEASHGSGLKGFNDGKPLGRDMTTEEAASAIKDFTPEQQQVYKDYTQELNTLRERSGHSLNGGNQGAWYGPHQFLDDVGMSQAYDPSLVNELRRTNAKTDVNGNARDYSTTPYEHYIQRYANATDAASQRMVDAVENKTVKQPNGQVTIEPTGVKVPNAAKEQLSANLDTVTQLRDEADRLAANGDLKGARQTLKQAQKATDKAFGDFMDAIPGAGSARNDAIKNVKALRGTYEQTLTQALTLSNVVNRAADQGTKLVESLKAPLVRGLERVINPIMKGNAMEGVDVNGLNTSKEALKAAKNVAKGTLGRDIRSNVRATVSMAGVGKNPAVRALAKADAALRAGGAAATEAGDLGTRNVMEALRIGASRPEAQGLKTVADYERYFNDYMKTQKFKDDLARVEQVQNPKIGLAGGETPRGTGNISNFLSKNVDNFVTTQAERAKAGLGTNRLVREANDYVKGNITGYAGVTSRVLGSVKNAAFPLKPLRAAVREAGSGDPAAVARATTMAAHAVADTIALYGTAAASAAILGNTNGLIGYTGAQPQQGSSQSAFNKANNVPANQWYVNIGGKRIYFDPARPFGAPGVAADLVGGAEKSGDVISAGKNALGQIANQAGGNSLPQTLQNFQTALADPTATDSAAKRAWQQVQQVLAPSTGFLNNVANWIDPTRRAPTNFAEDLQSNIPVLRASVPAAKDSRGNDIPNAKQISGGSSLFSAGNNPDAASVKAADPLMAEVNRLQTAGNDVMPTASNKGATNPNTDALAKVLMGDPLYTGADDKTKAAMLKGVLDGTVIKNINSGLSPDEQKALMEHTLVGSKDKAWLDDTGNANRYYNAVYDNAKANGTLTKADDNLQNKSGMRYKAVVAQVNDKVGATSDIQSMYQQISQSDFKAMINPKSDSYDPQTAQILAAYDQARTDAGVSDNKFTNRPKYDVQLAQSQLAKAGSRGSGGKAATQFAFANLPTSLIGTKGGTSQSSGGYANAAPLFTPLPDLKVPVGAPIPKGRSISVSKVKQV